MAAGPPPKARRLHAQPPSSTRQPCPPRPDWRNLRTPRHRYAFGDSALQGAAGANPARVPEGGSPARAAAGASPAHAPPPVREGTEFPAFASLGLGPAPEVYRRAVGDLRELSLMPEPAFPRPPPAGGSMGDVGGADRVSGRFRDSRRVPGETWPEHLQSAASTPFPPQVTRGRRQLRPVAAAAVEFTCSHQLDAVARREERVARMNKIRRSLTLLEEQARRSARARGQLPQVRTVAGSAAVVLIAALVDAMRYPDVALPFLILFGFPVTGIIPDSNVYRPVPRSPEEIAAFERRHRDILAPQSCRRWMDDLTNRVSRNGTRAERDPAFREGLARMEDKIAAEFEKSLTGPPRSLNHLRDAFQVPGGLGCRPLHRFVIFQGDKARAIDNGKSSGTNDAALLFETVCLPSCEWVAAAAAACLDWARRNPNAPTPELLLGTDDVCSAYRRVPCSQPECTLVCYWSLTGSSVKDPKPGAVYRSVFGHPFGLTAAVVNFNRIMEFTTTVASLFLGVLAEHYYDDYMVIEVDHPKAKGSAQQALDSLHKMLGMLPLAEDKHKPPGSTNDVLGVSCDLSQAARGTVIFQPTARRCEKVLAALTSHQDLDHLSPAEAASLVGKLGFICSSLFNRLGRALLAPLRERQHDNSGSTSWTPAMSRMLDALRIILDDASRSARRVDVRMDSDLPPILIYTDASCSSSEKGLGIVLVDTNPASPARLFARAECPEWILARFNDPDWVVNQLENLAAVSALMTFRGRLEGRRVFQFIDNTAAMSAIVHGYSRKPDLAVTANLYHVVSATLRTDVFFEWVPSKANIADIPSRSDHPDWPAFLSEGFEEVTMVLPTPEEWDNPTRILERHRDLDKRS